MAAGLEECKRARASLIKIAKGASAPAAAVDAVEAGLRHGFDTGSIVERERFADCVISTESLALRQLVLPVLVCP